MSITHPTTISLTEDDQKMREELQALGYTVIAIWRHGASSLLKELKKKKVDNTK